MEIMEEYIDEDILKWWGLKQGGGDPVTSNWLGVSTVVTPLTAIFTYLLAVNVCKYRVKALNFNFQGALIFYNSFQVLFSAYIFMESVITAISARYNVFCEPLHDTLSFNGRRMAVASWLFYISKYLDLLDTAFMIVKGNTHQVTTLHVFHHSSMLLNSWFGIRHVPTGHSFSIHLSNSFVHMVMYGYYMLSSCGPRVRPYLWWKPYLTQVQIYQFLFMWIHVACGLYSGCDYPKSLIYLVLIYLLILIGLFTNFYVKTYGIKKSRKPKQNGCVKTTESEDKPQHIDLLNNNEIAPIKDSGKSLQNGFLRKLEKSKENGFIKNTESPKDDKKKRS